MLGCSNRGPDVATNLDLQRHRAVRRGYTTTLAPQPFRLRAALVAVCIVVALLAGCGHRTKKEAARACNKAKMALFTAVSRGDFAEARRLRTSAYRDCDEHGELAAVDRQIVDGESNRQLRAAVATRRARERQAFVRFFLDFVRAHRDAPQLASIRASCEPPPPSSTAGVQNGDGAAPAPSRRRWCTAHRLVSNGRGIEIRYDAGEPRSFRFTTEVDGALDCAALGGRQTKQWSVAVPGGGAGSRASCAFDGEFVDLSAVVGSGDISSLHVFSPSYLDREPGARAILDAPSP